MSQSQVSDIEELFEDIHSCLVHDLDYTTIHQQVYLHVICYLGLHLLQPGVSTASITMVTQRTTFTMLRDPGYTCSHLVPTTDLLAGVPQTEPGWSRGQRLLRNDTKDE